MKRFVVPIVFTLLLSAVLVTIFLTVPLEPVLASQQGRSVDLMMRLLFSLAAVMFSLVISFLVYSIVVFRRQPGDTTEGTPIQGNTTLEVVWTAIPVLIVLALGTYGAIGVISLHQPAAPNELVVDVTGAQWNWTFTYPGLNITSSAELYLPVNRPVLFQIQSLDVVHSFWIPEFRIKMDAIPGIVNDLRITPTRVGDYKARCAELCGTAHAYMFAPVHVVEPAAFEQWVQQQAKSGGTPAQQGAKYAVQFGCTSCHSADGHPMIGPTYKGLYGSQVTLTDGTSVTADDAYLRNSIVNPSAQIVQGFADDMPKDFGTRLTADQITAIIEYIKSLK